MNAILPSASPLSFEGVTKQFGRHPALHGIDLALPAGHVVGLLGRNGAGKTTLLQIAAGLALPTAGVCHTLGERSDRLDTPQLSRLGYVQQESRFIEWMNVSQHLEFTGSFYPRWDRELQARLVDLLQVPLTKRIAHLSTGDRQKVGILLGVCHRPALLLLDEPMSSLDPIVRTRMLDVLVERLRDDGCTILISSHILNDIEKIVDWIVAVDAGRITENTPLDALQESFAEWTVVAAERELPPKFAEPFVLRQEQQGSLARLIVRTGDPDAAEAFTRVHGVSVRPRGLTLDEIFPLLINSERAAA